MNGASLSAVPIRSISSLMLATRRGVSISPQLIEAAVAATVRRNFSISLSLPHSLPPSLPPSSSRGAHVYRPTRAARQPRPPRVEWWNVCSAEAVRYQVTVAPRYTGHAVPPPVSFPPSLPLARFFVNVAKGRSRRPVCAIVGHVTVTAARNSSDSFVLLLDAN